MELNPQVADLVKYTFTDFAGDLYANENVHLHIDEARSFVAGSKRKYDLIQLALLDAFSASSAGLYALSESYVYTTEALMEYIDHLRTNGLLAITRWVKLPPRDAPTIPVPMTTAPESPFFVMTPTILRSILRKNSTMNEWPEWSPAWFIPSWNWRRSDKWGNSQACACLCCCACSFQEVPVVRLFSKSPRKTRK